VSRRALSDNLGRPERGSVAAGIPVEDAATTLFMGRALALAEREQPHPNPRVGAVIVGEHGDIVGEAAHVRAGEPHAEALALAAAGDRARGATIYVTLEPCSHQGRTPPCSRALIDAGIARVVVGAGDPDPRVSGSGIAQLREAGVDVITGALAGEVERIDPGYFHHRRTGKPLVTLKLATTLDGQIAAADRTSRWITGEEARRDGHLLRSESDVIIVGAGTVIDDDPSLDVRIDGYRGRHPRPVVIGGSRRLPSAARLLGRDPIVYVPRYSGIVDDEVVVPLGDQVDLEAVISDLGARGYVTALVEGGARLAASVIREGHVDRLVLYLAGKLGLGTGVPVFSGVFSTLADAVEVDVEAFTRMGNDLKIEAKVGK
jgi:diaminohydroxyphosphoribosylaminopyrimidine deaminase / 5-amino-6-(5-phosphoribosylamino)uracil reductase